MFARIANRSRYRDSTFELVGVAGFAAPSVMYSVLFSVRTVTCDPFTPSPFGGSFANVQINLQQKVGREITRASGFLTPVCDGTPHTYQVAITPTEGLAFHGGRALASVAGQICELDPVTFQQHCSTFLSSQEVRIHG